MRKAFTLLELLVCVAIIAILASLILPALAKAKAQGRRIACVNNERQVALAVRMYVDDFGCYPAYRMPNIGPVYSHTNYWDARLTNYTAGSTAVFACPARPEGVVSNWSFCFDGFAYPNRSYGYNCYGTYMGAYDPEIETLGLVAYFNFLHPRFVRDLAIARPSEMAMLADADSDADDDGDGDPNPQWLYPLTLSGKWHGGRAAVSFCDGHTLCLRIQALKGKRAMWNSDSQEH